MDERNMQLPLNDGQAMSMACPDDVESLDPPPWDDENLTMQEPDPLVLEGEVKRTQQRRTARLCIPRV